MGDRGQAGFGVAGDGADGFVVGLGHDDRAVRAFLAEVGGCGVPQLVEVQPGVGLDQGAGAVLPEAHPSGFRAEVAAGGGDAAGGAGSALGTEQARDQRSCENWR